VVVTTDNQQIREGLSQRDMGFGPNYLLFRPFHLCSCETPITIAQGVLYQESTGHPLDQMTSECITIAKKDLKPGEILDGIGDTCYRGSIELYQTAAKGRMLPLGLAKGGVMLREVRRDEVITYDDVRLNEDSVLLQLRRLQDAGMGRR